MCLVYTNVTKFRDQFQGKSVSRRSPPLQRTVNATIGSPFLRFGGNLQLQNSGLEVFGFFSLRF